MPHKFTAATLTLNPALDRTMYFDRSFTAGGLNRACAPSVLTPGSKGINVSRAWAAMGVQAPACIFSGGENGALMEKMLAAEGMECEVVPTAAETRMNVKMIDSQGVCTEANEAGGPVTKKELGQMLDLVAAIGTRVNYFALGGSIPQGVDKSVYKFCTEVLKHLGTGVLLDCDGEALAEGIKERPFLIKPNLYELSGLVGRELCTPGQAAKECRALNVDTGVNILCTLGADGAIWASEKGVWQVASPQGITVRGFTGAGDTFLAAFIYTYNETHDPARALEFASSAAAAKVELPGSGIPARAQMDKYLGQVRAARVM